MERAGWNYPTGDFRVSDADRDRALSELSEAFQAGRITSDEFDQRSGEALSSRTGRQLTALLADLPVNRAPAPRSTTLDQAQRIVATRIAIGASAVLATILGLSAVGTVALSQVEPTHHQLAQLRHFAQAQGLPVPPSMPPPHGLDLASAVTPAAIAVLLVVVIVFLRMHLARLRRS